LVEEAALLTIKIHLHFCYLYRHIPQVLTLWTLLPTFILSDHDLTTAGLHLIMILQLQACICLDKIDHFIIACSLPPSCKNNRFAYFSHSMFYRPLLTRSAALMLILVTGGLCMTMDSRPSRPGLLTMNTHTLRSSRDRKIRQPTSCQNSIGELCKFFPWSFILGCLYPNRMDERIPVPIFLLYSWSSSAIHALCCLIRGVHLMSHLSHRLPIYAAHDTGCAFNMPW
jgi:hypothetical protein